MLRRRNARTRFEGKETVMLRRRNARTRFTGHRYGSDSTKGMAQKVFRKYGKALCGELEHILYEMCVGDQLTDMYVDTIQEAYPDMDSDDVSVVADELAKLLANAANVTLSR